MAQLGKIDQFNARRRDLVNRIEDELRDIPEVRLAHVYPGTQPNYWVYPVWGPRHLGHRGELSYVEVEFRRMQEMRHTSLGIPLPDYVHYRPGICPLAEASTEGSWSFFVHHSTEDAELEDKIRDFKDRLGVP